MCFWRSVPTGLFSDSSVRPRFPGVVWTRFGGGVPAYSARPPVSWLPLLHSNKTYCQIRCLCVSASTHPRARDEARVHALKQLTRVHTHVTSLKLLSTLTNMNAWTYSLAHSLDRSLPPSLAHSLTHPLTHTITHSLTRLLTHFLPSSLAHWFTQTLDYPTTHTLSNAHTSPLTQTLCTQALPDPPCPNRSSAALLSWSVTPMRSRVCRDRSWKIMNRRLWGSLASGLPSTDSVARSCRGLRRAISTSWKT